MIKSNISKSIDFVLNTFDRHNILCISILYKSFFKYFSILLNACFYLNNCLKFIRVELDVLRSKTPINKLFFCMSTLIN